MCKIFSGQDPDNFVPVTRHVRLNKQSTSICMESLFWEVLDDLATSQGFSTANFLSTLHTEVLLEKGEVKNFTSLIRCTCMIYLNENAPVEKFLIGDN